MSTTKEYAVIGTRPPRYDAVDKTTGRALFGPDTSLPGLLYGKILRSPNAHARIRTRSPVLRRISGNGPHPYDPAGRKAPAK